MSTVRNRRDQGSGGLPLAPVAIATSGAAAIHLAVVSEHLAEEGPLVGGFFLGAGLVQALWAILVLRGAPRGLLVAGIVGNLALVGLWALSRTAGLPFGSHPGVPEPVGRPDLAAVVFEMLAAAVALRALQGRERRSSRPALTALGLAAAIPVTAWALLPGAGHLHAGDAAHHSAYAGGHAIHLTLLGAAPVLFLALVVARIARTGFPSFSWRLAPGSTAAIAPSPSPAPAAAPTPSPPALR